VSSQQDILEVLVEERDKHAPEPRGGVLRLCWDCSRPCWRSRCERCAALAAARERKRYIKRPPRARHRAADGEAAWREVKRQYWKGRSK